ncbi:MAG: pantetheine-phosphate adenylyltransferase [Crocinitomicaceae bacterium]|jgi:pantetheine-phosphate adenylyltransferase|nr:pantetheine-phosphate adenylyltransferase [Crocinitomicaceae bacterium]
MNKIALFPGSFDPYTKGHEYIVSKGLEIFDEIIIGIGINTEKKYLFDLEKRIIHIEQLYMNDNRVSVKSYKGLTVDYCKEVSVSHIIRGLRNSIDFEYEKSIAQMNRSLSEIETLFILTSESLSPINSSIVREIHKNKGDISLFVTHPELLV